MQCISLALSKVIKCQVPRSMSLHISRFGIKSEICLLIASVPVHCFCSYFSLNLTKILWQKAVFTETGR